MHIKNTDFDIASLYPIPIQFNTDVSSVQHWVDEYGSAGTVNAIQMAEMVTKFKNGTDAVYYKNGKDVSIQLSNKLVKNYRIIKQLDSNKTNHNSYIMFNIDFRHDVVIIRNSNGTFDYLL